MHTPTPRSSATAPVALRLSAALLALAVLLPACAKKVDPRERRRRVEEVLQTHEPKAGSGPAETVVRGLPTVRVTLSAPSRAGTTKLRVVGAYRVLDSAGNEVRSARGLDSDLVLGATASLAGTPVPPGGLVLVPAQDGDLAVGDRRYPGSLRVVPGPGGTFQAEVETDLETYVEGVVPAEIPAAFPTESQRVQAVLARTYALSAAPSADPGAVIRMADHGGTDQEYGGIPPMPAHRIVAAEAARSTRGMVLVGVSDPIRAYYHSTCGGHTAPVETVFPDGPSLPLSGVPCASCTQSKYYRWSADLGGDDVARSADLVGPLTAVSVISADLAGRARTLRVTAGGRSRDVAAALFRLRVGPSALRSVWFDELAVVGGALHVSGRGWGHGVGLCQMGAKELAERGLLAADILTTYYPGARLVRMW